MSNPTTLNMKTANTIISIPIIEEVMMSFPALTFSGFPEDVKTVALPYNIARKAAPPAIPKII